MKVSDQQALLRRLVDITPPPPGDNMDPAEVLLAARTMVEERLPVLEEMKSVMNVEPSAFKNDDGCREMLELLERRGSGWQAAMERAARITQQRLVASKRLRRERQVLPGDSR